MSIAPFIALGIALVASSRARRPYVSRRRQYDEITVKPFRSSWVSPPPADWKESDYPMPLWKTLLSAGIVGGLLLFSISTIL